MTVGDVPVWAARLAALLLGAAWGSFFNVAIHRWPRGESVVYPPSHCPACGARIPARHNIPLVSWLRLRGRAACCGTRIPGRYALVELLGTVLCVAIVERAFVAQPPLTPLVDGLVEAVVYFVFAGGLIVATFVDLEWMEIPDEVSIPGAAVGLVTAPLRAEPGTAAVALGAGGGFLAVQVLFVWLYERSTGRRGMGEGDAKLLMMIGAFVGWRGALFALVAGALQGLIVAVIGVAGGRSFEPTASVDSGGAEEMAEAEAEGAESHDDGSAAGDSSSSIAPALKVPFGPFLALGGLEFLFFGEWLVDAYLGLF